MNPWGVAGDRAATDVGEFDWGAGLTPKGYDDPAIGPADGGRYHGTAPEQTRPWVHVGSNG
jgi:hypothetical protein